MAQIHVEPKHTSKWPFIALTLIVITAVWLILSRNTSDRVTNSAMRDSTVRDSVAGTLAPPDTTRMIRDSVIPPTTPPTPPPAQR